MDSQQALYQPSATSPVLSASSALAPPAPGTPPGYSQIAQPAGAPPGYLQVAQPAGAPPVFAAPAAGAPPGYAQAGAPPGYSGVAATVSPVRAYAARPSKAAGYPQQLLHQTDALQLWQYTDRSVALLGEEKHTRALADMLKATGGRWNKNLTVNDQTVGGWIFSLDKQPYVVQVMDGYQNGSVIGVPTEEQMAQAAAKRRAYAAAKAAPAGAPAYTPYAAPAQAAPVYSPSAVPQRLMCGNVQCQRLEYTVPLPVVGNKVRLVWMSNGASVTCTVISLDGKVLMVDSCMVRDDADGTTIYSLQVAAGQWQARGLVADHRVEFQ